MSPNAALFVVPPAHLYPTVTPHSNCRLRLLKQQRIKDFLLMEEEFIQNQERLKPQEERNAVRPARNHAPTHISPVS